MQVFQKPGQCQSGSLLCVSKGVKLKMKLIFIVLLSVAIGLAFADSLDLTRCETEVEPPQFKTFSGMVCLILVIAIF